jgi:integrase
MVDVRTRRADGGKVRDRKIVEGPQTMARQWGERRQAVLLGELRAPEPTKIEAENDGEPKKVMTVAQWAPLMERHYQGKKQSAIDSAMGILWTHIVQRVGHLRLDQIRQSVMDALEATWRTGGYTEIKRDRAIKPTRSRKTINNRKMVVLTMLKYAIDCADESGLAAMPCRIKLAKVDAQKVPRFYEVETYEQIVEGAAKMRDPRALAIVLLGGEAGLRVGEMMALKWPDVSYRSRRVTIRASLYQRTVDQTFEDATKGGLEKPIPMSRRLVAAMRKLERIKNGDHVLQSEGKAMTWRAVTWIMKKIERAVGLPETGALHVLRHTYCSHLAQAGVPARTIQEMGRHADLSTTMRYMHLARDAKENAIERLDKLRAS